MSERKSVRDSIKKQIPSKPSSVKPKTLFSAKSEREVPTVTKNLLREFNQLDLQNVRHQKNPKSEHSIKETDRNAQSLDESSALQSEDSRLDKYEFADEPTGFKRTRAEMPEYAELQLPRSYILAMRGLQEAVEQREKETRKLKKLLGEQTALFENATQQLQAEAEERSALEARLNESIIENKFYRQTIMEMKAQAAEQLRVKIDLEKQIKSGQQINTQLNAQAEGFKKDIEASKMDKTGLKEELQRAAKSMEQKKNDYNELLLKRSEQFSHNYAEVVALRQELSKLKEQHEKDIGQINMLKEQVEILSDRLVIEEAKLKEAKLIQQRAQLQKFERELQVNRHILQEVTFDQNCLRQAFNASSPTAISKTRAPSLPVQEQQSAPAPTPVKQLKEPEQSQALERSSKQQRPSTLRQERSVSRLRQTNNFEHPDRRELIGQMRELMRHEKELISLNYQMEVLERGMLDANQNKREQTQRTYVKLRRNIQKKEADVRELKSFIDKATTHTLK